MSRYPVLALLIGLNVGAAAEDYGWLDNPQLIILRATVDPATQIVHIEGENFGEVRLPNVTLDNESLTVRAATRTVIEAGPLPPGTPLGSHILRVVAGDDRSRFDAFSLEIGAEPAAQETPPPALPSRGVTYIGILDASGDVGWSPALAIGSDGLPVVAYLDYTNLNLKVAHCSDPACSSVSQTVLDAEGDVGWSVGIAIGAKGMPIIAYIDNKKRQLKVARCGNPSCTSAAISVIEHTGDVGKFVSIAVPADGMPVILYYETAHRDLMAALCRNTSCQAGAAIRTIDSTGDVGWHNALVIGNDGNPMMSYFDSTRRDLKLARCLDRSCGEVTASALDLGGVGMGTDIVIGKDGLPFIAYWDFLNDDLKAAHCGEPDCDAPQLVRVDTEGSVGSNPAVAIGVDGLPIIAYHDHTNSDLKVAHCSDVACSTADISTVDATGSVGWHIAIAIGRDGLPIIAYYDETNGDLKLAHCGDVACSEPQP